MSKDILVAQLTIEERHQNIVRIIRACSPLKATGGIDGLERNFKLKCLQRIYVLSELSIQHSKAGRPVVASLIARGILETGGLLELFSQRMARIRSAPAVQQLELLKLFLFATKKFGEKKKSIHAMDCVRSLGDYYSDIEGLYDVLCEAVHPNWLGVSRFSDVVADDSGQNELSEQELLISMAVFQAVSIGQVVVETHFAKSASATG
jgi:hypothetical protein